MPFIKLESEGWSLEYRGLELLRHSVASPFLRAGTGTETISMHHGNFEITDAVERMLAPVSVDARAVPQPAAYATAAGGNAVSGNSVRVACDFGEYGTIECVFVESGGRLEATFSASDARLNRFTLRLSAEEGEGVYGCGEQFSHFNLRGKNYPLWTREQGVGRNKATEITKLADKDDCAGGDYHTTFYPQTTFVSSRKYFFHAYTWAYADFDFSAPGFHELRFWELPSKMVWSVKSDLISTVQDISALLGRQGILPDWVHDGMTLGIQDGTKICLDKTERAIAHGVLVNGIWAQDWVGQRFTSFGKRLKWNWVWNSELYPELDRVIPELNARGIAFLGYINPYVLENNSLYDEAKAKGFLALDAKGETYLVDFGEFYAGLVDLTNPAAFDWYKEVIKKYLIGFGLSGWMADFGEYLPTDVVLHSGIDARIAHNEWPGLWARVNREAIEEAGKADEIIFFMRAGNADSLKYCPMMWAGDQNVDWSEDDGLPSVITSALSLAMSGMGLQHSDVGGYTTLYSLKRTKELFLRWAEFAACTPMMRSHEGNRPKDNWQFDSDDETLDLLAPSTRLFVALKPYRKLAVEENARDGTPVMRPLFLHYDDAGLAGLKDEYLLGRDLLVAPVIVEGALERTVLLPADDWIHVWTGERYSGGSVTVAAPLGRIPLFYRAVSPFGTLFESLRSIYS